MERLELIEMAKKAITAKSAEGQLAEASEFIRVYSGEKNSFFKLLKEVKSAWSDGYTIGYVRNIFDSYIKFLALGIADGISIDRKAQLVVVSDFLEQARKLLETNDVHPAAPCVLIGASLEEFLRNWIEEKDIPMSNNKHSIDSYGKLLREAELITKQDHKDITSWAGLRNLAAHGKWEEVSEKKRIDIMLEGVNLFMRKYGQ